MINLHDTLENKIIEIDTTNIIKIYSCGITVYDVCHIGHIRLFLFFDFFIKYLNFLGIKIIYIRNITDIDDKIIKKALNNKCSLYKISEKYTKIMNHDIKKLNLIAPSFEPKATSFILQMIKLIDKLIEKNIAYKSKNNDIYFNITKFKNYGNLSKRKKINKNEKLDFVLWKNQEKNNKFYWKYNFKIGRPGWHTECSSMILYYGKKNIDIHAGGQDLVFPHHENELAQFESIKECKVVKIWLHIGHVKINNKKMSKSNKNYILIKNLINKFDLETIKLYFLLSHFKKNINFSFHNIEKAKNLSIKLNEILNKKNLNEFEYHKKNNLFNILNNNFNTPKLITEIFNYIKKKNIENLTETEKINLLNIKKICILFELIKKYKIKNKVKKFSKNIINLIKKRNLARESLKYDEADRLKLILENLNIKIQDTKNGSNYSYNII